MPGKGDEMRKPAARRSVCCTVSDRLPFTLGIKALRTTWACPCACRMARVRPTAPRLYSRPRATASRNESFPENGIFVVLSSLPLYVPVVRMEGLMVFTLLVVPGTGD